MTGVLTRGENLNTDTQRGGHYVKTETRDWSDGSTAKKCQRWPAATRSWDRGMEQILLQSFQKDPNPAGTLILVSWLTEM